MKTLSQTTIALVLSYFAIVPSKIDIQMEEIKYSPESIKLDKEIQERMTLIESDKEKIYNIQKELDIN